MVGVNDDFMGEELCAWIIVKEGQTITPADILSYCQGKIAHFKIPRYIRFVDDFPLTVTGKVKKNEMRHISNELLKQPTHDIIEIKPIRKTV